VKEGRKIEERKGCEKIALKKEGKIRQRMWSCHAELIIVK